MRYCTKCGTALQPNKKFCTLCGTRIKSKAAAPQAQPVLGAQPMEMRGETPPPASKRRLILALAALIVVGGSLTLYFVLKKTARSGSKTITAGASVDLVTQTVASSGGTIIVSKSGDPLNGFKIDVPNEGYSDARTFKISYAPITKHDFGPDFTPLTPLITVSNGGGYSQKAMTLTVPVHVPAGYFAMGFLYDDKTGELEGMPLLESTSDHVTVSTLNFARSTMNSERVSRSAVNFDHSMAAALVLADDQSNDEAESKIVMSALPESSLVGEFDSG